MVDQLRNRNLRVQSLVFPGKHSQSEAVVNSLVEASEAQRVALEMGAQIFAGSMA